MGRVRMVSTTVIAPASRAITTAAMTAARLGHRRAVASPKSGAGGSCAGGRSGGVKGSHAGLTSSGHSDTRLDMGRGRRDQAPATSPARRATGCLPGQGWCAVARLARARRALYAAPTCAAAHDTQSRSRWRGAARAVQAQLSRAQAPCPDQRSRRSARPDRQRTSLSPDSRPGADPASSQPATRQAAGRPFARAASTLPSLPAAAHRRNSRNADPLTPHSRARHDLAAGGGSAWYQTSVTSLTGWPVTAATVW